MTKQLNKFIRPIVFISFCLLIPLTARAIGQISQPIIIKDALRGSDYQEEIVVFNSEKKSIKVALTAEGKIKDWVKFYKLGDAKNAVSEVEIKASAKLKVNAIIHVPDSIPNGEYKGAISVASKPDTTATTTESVAYLSQKIDRPVTITVSDNEILKFDASIIPKNYDLVKDEPLSIRMIYDNQGNVEISPQIQFKIKKDEQIIYNIIYPYPEEMAPVKPGAQYEITPIVLQTSGYEKGKYLAEFNFLVNNESKLYKKFGFSVELYNKKFIFGWFNFDIRLILAAVLAAALAGAVMAGRKYFHLKKITVEEEEEIK